MRLAIILVALVACESADDFPPPPPPIPWHAVPLVPMDGMVNGTGYRIDLPRGASPRGISSTETAFDSNGLTVTVRVEAEALDVDRAIERVGGIVVTSRQVRAEGWVIAYDEGKSTFGNAYVDDGALTCNAQANGDGTPWSHTDALLAICTSLKATTPLANPSVYPAGASPHEQRAAACKEALDHVARIEAESLALPKRKKLTKQEVADRNAAADARAAVYAKRQLTCESMRWSEAQLRCLNYATKLEVAPACVTGW